MSNICLKGAFLIEIILRNWLHFTHLTTCWMPIKTAGTNSGRWDVAGQGACGPGLGNGAINHSILPRHPEHIHHAAFQAEAPARPFPSPETDSTHLAFFNSGLVDISGDSTWRYCGNAWLPGHRAYISCREEKKMGNDMQITGEI
jgi:hypothetical protein